MSLLKVGLSNLRMRISSSRQRRWRKSLRNCKGMRFLIVDTPWIGRFKVRWRNIKNYQTVILRTNVLQTATLLRLEFCCTSGIKGRNNI